MSQLDLHGVGERGVPIRYPVPCFWCGDQLEKEFLTRDHLLARPVRRLINYYGGRFVPSCWACNQHRSRISNLFYLLVRMRNFAYADPNPRTFRKLRDKHLRYMPITLFRERILAHMDDFVEMKYCLGEINAVEFYNPADHNKKITL